jgi:hypothetical protein
MPHKFFEDQRPQNGLTFNELLKETEDYLANTNPKDLNDSELEMFNNKKLNTQRISRIQKTFKPNNELKNLVKQINKPQLWMVITEDWCGDSAQNLPYIYEISKLSENIKLRIIKRDENLDIMEFYLTNGKARSIPKLVVFDESGNELFQWGPRPEEGQKLVSDLKAQGFDKSKFMLELHSWYAKNKGFNLIEEFKQLIIKTIF